MTTRELLEMEISEVKKVTTNTYVLRVPDGWIYKFYRQTDSYSKIIVLVSTVLVPLSEEGFYEDNSL